MIAAKLPQKRATVSNGLRKRPQFEQIVNYIANDQETIKYPNRMAKQIRNHPFMTQLDFFDMQEDQHRSWEEQVRQREAAQLAGAMGLTAAQARAAAGPYGGGGAGPMGGGYGPILNRGGGRGGGGVIGPAGPQVGPARPQPQAGAGVRAAAAEARAAGPPAGAGMAGNYGPVRDGGQPGAGPRRTRLIGKQNDYGQMTPGVRPVPSGVVGQLAIQDADASASADQMMVDADQRAREAIEREHARRSAAASAAAASLYQTGEETQQDASSSSAAAAAASSGAAASSSGGKGKGKDAEMQKRLVAKNMGTSVNMMDAQAQALQDAAKKADAQITHAAIQKPVPKSQSAPIRATRKTLKGSVTKGSVTKGIVNAPELKHALQVKRINAQATKLSKPIDQEDVIMMKTGKPVKPAPKTKPVKKLNLKDKSSELAKKIKYTVERKGAEVKKDEIDKAIRDLGKKFKETDMTGASSSKAAPKAAPKKRGRPKKAPIRPSS